MRTFGWMADQAGCGHYRIKLPMDALRETYQADIGYGVRFQRQNPPDLLVGQRLGQPRTLKLLEWLRVTHGTRLVYEVDDDLFAVPGRNPASRVYTGAIRQGMIDCIRIADHVTVSTPELASRMAEITGDRSRITVLENSVPDAAFATTDPAVYKDNVPVVIGWRGSATHVEDFAEARHGVGRILERSDTRLKLVGAAPANNLPVGKVEHTGWIKGVEAFYQELDFDIGIVPLADNIFNQSKSHLAVLEMAARGIPVVASDLPSYRRFITHGENGFLVRQKHEWAKYLKVLVEDPELRVGMGDNAMRRALDFHTDQVVGGYREVYSSVLGGSL